MRTLRTWAATAVAAASLTLGLAAAAPASATTTNNACSYWNDSNTQGVYCDELTNGNYFQAYAVCNNGTVVYGVWHSVGSKIWSYAFCTSVGSSRYSGGVITQ
ncbi:hypothetical protein ACFWJ4_32685 [Kitasatospora sp. NPDC127067]|uniref:hypothetical protein n=1 Tax=Kitasatospora sp. NPDC127067 TaxID=3347126 RepID=UPI00364FC0D2